MANTRTLGEVVSAVNEGRFVRVKGIGILVLANRQRRSRKGKDEKEDKK